MEKPNSNSKYLEHFYHFFRAWKYTNQGLAAAFKGEMAFRQEVILGFIGLLLTIFWLRGDLLWRILANCAWLVQMAMELLNSAIEAVVDMTSPGYNDLAKKAKDMGSAAVFCTTVCWILLFAAAVANHYGLF